MARMRRAGVRSLGRAALVLAFAAGPVAAATLYKSVGPDGTILFSDTPPPQGARLLEHRTMPGDAPPSLTPMEEAFVWIEADADLARANTELDLAEHALALACRPAGSPREGLRLGGSRMTPADRARIEFYRRNVAAARQALLERLRERHLAAK